MVTKTKEQIDLDHIANANSIRASYHEKHEISHEDYHSQLNAENERYKAELIVEGYLLLPRDLTAEIDAIKLDIKDIKERIGK